MCTCLSLKWNILNFYIHHTSGFSLHGFQKKQNLLALLIRGADAIKKKKSETRPYLNCKKKTHQGILMRTLEELHLAVWAKKFFKLQLKNVEDTTTQKMTHRLDMWWWPYITLESTLLLFFF